jgi:hypothetical protein
MQWSQRCNQICGRLTARSPASHFIHVMYLEMYGRRQDIVHHNWVLWVCCCYLPRDVRQTKTPGCWSDWIATTRRWSRWQAQGRTRHHQLSMREENSVVYPYQRYCIGIDQTRMAEVDPSWVGGGVCCSVVITLPPLISHYHPYFLCLCVNNTKQLHIYLFMTISFFL